MPATPPLPRRILVVRLGAIGDVANALVFAASVKRADPDVHLGWVVHDLARPLVHGHPDVDRVHLWERSSGWKGYRALGRELRAEGYELAVDLQRTLKSGLVARASGAPRILGYDRRRAKEGNWLLSTERIAPGPPEAHMIEQYLAFARHLGLDGPAVRRLPIVPEAERYAEERVRELGGAPILLQLGATKPANRWRPERFGELAARLAADDLGPVCLSGSAADRQLARAALAACSASERVHDLTGEPDLPRWISLARRSRLFVGCDTGPMHLAAAVGLPVVALFGPADPHRTGPYGWQEESTRARVLRVELACSPCNDRVCRRPSGQGPRDQCMDDLSVDRVHEAARSMLGALAS